MGYALLMKYDFDTPVSRHGTGSLKWQKYVDTDILPFWVADMDYASAPEIVDALRERVNHQVFGYTVPFEEVTNEVVAYLARVHDYRIDPDWLVWLPGLVQGLNLICRSVGNSGDAVMTATPIYPPFRSSPVFSDRKRIEVPCKYNDDRWVLDIEGMEAAVTPETKLFLFCSPYNPIGRAFNREELEAVVDFCKRHDLVLCSDEIHCDLILDEDTSHICTAKIDENVGDRLVTFMSPSKTYNLPGLACAYAIIPDDSIRNAFKHALRGLVTEINCFGYAGCHAAYKYGESWRQQLIPYLRTNRDRLFSYVAEHMPEIKMWPLEATYLAWMDVRGLDLDDPVAYFESFGVGLSNGSDFGMPGYVRFNFGCTYAMLEEGLERMNRAMQAWRASTA